MDYVYACVSYNSNSVPCELNRLGHMLLESRMQATLLENTHLAVHFIS